MYIAKNINGKNQTSFGWTENIGQGKGGIVKLLNWLIILYLVNFAKFHIPQYHFVNMHMYVYQIIHIPQAV